MGRNFFEKSFSREFHFSEDSENEGDRPDDGGGRRGTERECGGTSDDRRMGGTAAGQTFGGFPYDAFGFSGKITASERGVGVRSGLLQDKVYFLKIKSADVFHTIHSFLASVHVGSPPVVYGKHSIAGRRHIIRTDPKKLPPYPTFPEKIESNHMLIVSYRTNWTRFEGKKTADAVCQIS